MKKYLNIMFDTETLSCRPSAAIIQIAAMPFTMDGDEAGDKVVFNKLTFQDFSIDINATTCAMYGMDFDMETVRWWAKDTSANAYFKKADDEVLSYSIKSALNIFAIRLSKWKEVTGADELKMWCQGTDFDVALIREAYRLVFGTERDLPWKHRNVRDARTYFLEAAEMFEPENRDPYSIIKIEGEKHHALDDCRWSIAAVQWAYKKYKNVSTEIKV